MKKLMLAAAVFTLALTAAPRDSHAGLTSNFGSCYRYSDGSAYCSGNFEGWRTSSDANAYALFDNWGTNYGYFYAYFGGQTYSCSTSSSYPAVLALWPVLSTTRSYFYVSISSSGVCTSAAISNGTNYQ